MTLDTGPLEDAIEARVKTVISRVWISQVPSDLPTPEMPYVVIFFGGPVRASSDHHITSTRNDTVIGYCTVQVISLTDKSARDVNNKIRNALVGFRPTDAGEMVTEGGLAYSRGSNDVKPTTYYRETGYSYRMNLSWNA